MFVGESCIFRIQLAFNNIQQLQQPYLSSLFRPFLNNQGTVGDFNASGFLHVVLLRAAPDLKRPDLLEISQLQACILQEMSRFPQTSYNRQIINPNKLPLFDCLPNCVFLHTSTKKKNNNDNNSSLPPMSLVFNCITQHPSNLHI